MEEKAEVFVITEQSLQNKIYYILPNVLFMRFLFDYKVLPLQLLQLLLCRFFTVIFVEHICGTPNP